MLTLADIAAEIGAKLVGDPAYPIRNVATLQAAQPDQLSFLANSKYTRYLSDTRAGGVIVQSQYVDLVPTNALLADDPYVAYAKAAQMLNPVIPPPAVIHPTAVIATEHPIPETVSIGAQCYIGAGVILGENVIIGPGCVILDKVQIGAETELVANVTLCKGVIIGQRGLIHPGVVIGADGFGIANDNGKWIKVPQLGRVRIGDDVEIGANTTIDRGAIEDTVIADGVKLDNQIQVGHNTTIGKHTAVAGCVGIAGSTHIGAHCAIGGGAGLGGHIDIADGVQLTGMTMVTKSITKPGRYSSGIPAEPTSQWHRQTVRYRQLEQLAQRVKRLERILEDK